MQITVADIQKINVTDGQILVIFVDIDGKTVPDAKKLLHQSATFMRQSIPNLAIQIIVVPAGTYSFGVIDPTTGQTHPVPQQSLGSSTPGASGDAFDRAMKGLG